MTKNDVLQDRLFFHAALMMFLGFLVGFLVGTPPLRERVFAAPRVLLSSHILGTLRAVLLFALGAAWPHIYLSDSLQEVAFWCLVGSFWFDFLIHVLGGVFGPDKDSQCFYFNRVGSIHTVGPQILWRLYQLGIPLGGVFMFVGACLVLMGFSEEN